MRGPSRCVVFFSLALCVVIFSGCAVMVGDKVVGIESGSFFYSAGVLWTNYKASFDEAWAACEKTLADMKAGEVTKKKKIGTGTIDSMIGDDKVHMVLEYVAKDTTSVGVRVGLAGNDIASKLLQEKIGANLQKK